MESAIPVWSWWTGAIVLALIPIAHWSWLRRAVAVSGRFSALVDRLRVGTPRDPEIDQATLLEMLRAETAEAFGEEALEEGFDPEAAAQDATERRPPPQSELAHLLFLIGLTVGGAASALLAGGLSPFLGLRSEAFASLVDRIGIPSPAILVFGGLCVGFGTRMAAGCTSGHGLCGVSQGQAGSIASTAAFFGAGVAISFALGALL